MFRVWFNFPLGFTVVAAYVFIMPSAAPAAIGRPPPPAPEIARRLAPLCRQYGIERLELFGSTARGDARPGSDVDLIATFREHPGLRIVAIEETMAELLGVRVDLLTRDTVAEMTNPYRKESIERDRCVIYAA